MHALKDKLVRIVAQVEDTFHAHDIGTGFGDEIAEPLADL
jgi:hypothetical protein